MLAGHIIACPEFARLYKTDPARALLPAQEYARWAESGEADAEKAAARQAQVGRTDDARAAMARRFATKDPLEG